jgi:hypothetical protein
MGAKQILDQHAAQFRINTGGDIYQHHMKFMLNGVKIEFTYFKHFIQQDILENAEYEQLEGGSTLKILPGMSPIKYTVLCIQKPVQLRFELLSSCFSSPKRTIYGI